MVETSSDRWELKEITQLFNTLATARFLVSRTSPRKGEIKLLLLIVETTSDRWESRRKHTGKYYNTLLAVSMLDTSTCEKSDTARAMTLGETGPRHKQHVSGSVKELKRKHLCRVSIPAQDSVESFHRSARKS